MKSRVGLPSPATLLAVIAIVVATGGVSKATVPDSEGLIHACVTPQTGEMRILDPDAVPALCKTGQYLLTWSAKRPSEGDEGDEGDRGRRGKQGEQGEQGESCIPIPFLGTSEETNTQLIPIPCFPD